MLVCAAGDSGDEMAAKSTALRFLWLDLNNEIQWSHAVRDIEASQWSCVMGSLDILRKTRFQRGPSTESRQGHSPPDARLLSRVLTAWRH